MYDAVSGEKGVSYMSIVYWRHVKRVVRSRSVQLPATILYFNMAVLTGHVSSGRHNGFQDGGASASVSCYLPPPSWFIAHMTSGSHLDQRGHWKIT